MVQRVKQRLSRTMGDGEEIVVQLMMFLQARGKKERLRERLKVNDEATWAYVVEIVGDK